MLSVANKALKLSVVMLNVAMLSVIMLNVVVPHFKNRLMFPSRERGLKGCSTQPILSKSTKVLYDWSN
jgi:hypothetical protein